MPHSNRATYGRIALAAPRKNTHANSTFFFFFFFDAADDLILAIGDDIKFAKEKFREPEVAALATDHPFWTEVAEQERMASSSTRSG